MKCLLKQNNPPLRKRKKMISDFDLKNFAADHLAADPESFLEKCIVLHKFLTEYNTRVNLTRLTTPEDFCYKHVADSLSITRCFPEIAEKPFIIADIGCGAGFPSLILALAFPQLQITAIDSIGKKITFVRQAAELLGLSNLTAVCGRSTELNCKKEFQNKFDIVTARAVAPSPKICREASRFLRRNGRYIFYKTPTQAAEEAPLLANMKNMRWENTPVFELPGNAGERLFTTGIFTQHQ